MQDLLSKGRIAPTKINPKILLLYGPPKIGKTEIVAWLRDLLLLDYEKGSEAVFSNRRKIYAIRGETAYDEFGNIIATTMDAIYRRMVQYAQEETAHTGKPAQVPFTFMGMDTIDELETLCEVEATIKYRESTLGKNFDGKSVLDLPKGAGYYHLRNEVLYQIDRFSGLCEYLILLSHIKETLLNKGGVDVSVQDISLTGKLGAMVCAKADAIGYVYRKQGADSRLMVNFQTFDTTSVMGARFPRLAGKNFVMDWKTIYLPDGKNIGPDGPEIASPHVQQSAAEVTA